MRGLYSERSSTQGQIQRVETRIVLVQGSRVRDLKVNKETTKSVASKSNLLGRSIHSHEVSRLAAFDYRLGHHAASAAHVNPVQTRRYIQPLQKSLRQQAAPASHPLIVMHARSPFIYFHRLHHHHLLNVLIQKQVMRQLSLMILSHCLKGRVWDSGTARNGTDSINSAIV